MNVRVAVRLIRPLAASFRHISSLKPRIPVMPCLLGSVRQLATPPPMLASSDMSMETYHTISDNTMDTLLAAFEDIIDSVGDRQYEVEYSSGVLTLTLGTMGTYVINKQPPNKQIWLSSPISGPKRYDYSETKRAWVYSRDDQPLGSLLKKELEALLHTAIELKLL